MTNIGTNFLSFLPLVSRIGADARVLMLPLLDFLLDSGYQVDLTASVQSAQLLHPIQSIWVDASGATYGVFTVQVFGTGQTIRVPAGYQGYVPILATNTFIFTITNPGIPNPATGPGPQLFTIGFMNVPFTGSLWIGGGGYGIGGLGLAGLGN